MGWKTMSEVAGGSVSNGFHRKEVRAVLVVLVVTERCKSRRKGNHVIQAERHNFYDSNNQRPNTELSRLLSHLRM